MKRVLGNLLVLALASCSGDDGSSNADNATAESITISLGGVNFDPIIRSITLTVENNTVTLTADVDDNSADEELTYRWTTSGGSIANSASQNTTISNYDPTQGLSVSLRITDPGQLSDSQSCTLAANATTNTCDFID